MWRDMSNKQNFLTHEETFFCVNKKNDKQQIEKKKERKKCSTQGSRTKKEKLEQENREGDMKKKGTLLIV